MLASNDDVVEVEDGYSLQMQSDHDASPAQPADVSPNQSAQF